MNDEASQSGPKPEAPPAPSAQPTSCIETELNEINHKLAVAVRLKEYKAALEILLEKTRSAMEEYTVQKYNELLQRWKEQDKNIVELLNKLHCVTPKLETVFAESVCPVFATIADLRRTLAPDQPKPTPKPGADDGLYRQRDWQKRHYDLAQAAYDKARGKLAAWEKPAQTIDKALTDNAKLISDANKALAQPNPAVLLYDVMVKLLPMHWMIGPPDARQAAGSAGNPARFFKCGTTDAWGQVKAMIGPQPSLIKPTEYLPEICDKVLKAYNEAKQALAEADGELNKIDEAIKRTEKSLGDKTKSLEKDAKAALLGASLTLADQKPSDGQTGTASQQTVV